MNTQGNVKTIENFFAAVGCGDKPGLLALSAEDIEWIIPGEGWPLAGTHRGLQILPHRTHVATVINTLKDFSKEAQAVRSSAHLDLCGG
jgi:ketosteroid isomerase-like protein